MVVGKPGFSLPVVMVAHKYSLLSLTLLFFPVVMFQCATFVLNVYFQLTTENNAYNSHAKTTDWIRLPSDVSNVNLRYVF